MLWEKDRAVSADFIRSLLAFSANQYGEDYVYAYIYLTEMASAVQNGTSAENFSSASAASCLVCGGNCISKMKNNMISKFCSQGIYVQNSSGTVTGTKSWSELLSLSSPSNRDKALFIYGLALHTATDSFAHSSYADGVRLDHTTNGNADVVTYKPNRYTCSAVLAQKLVMHAANREVGTVSDYIAINTVYDGSFKMGRLNLYIKSINASAYNTFKTFLDGMTQ